MGKGVGAAVDLRVGELTELVDDHPAVGVADGAHEHSRGRRGSPAGADRGDAGDLVGAHGRDQARAREDADVRRLVEEPARQAAPAARGRAALELALEVLEARSHTGGHLADGQQLGEGAEHGARSAVGEAHRDLRLAAGRIAHADAPALLDAGDARPHDVAQRVVLEDLDAPADVDRADVSA